MEDTGLRVERARPAGWPPFRRRRRDLEIALPLRTIEDLFTAPTADPFSADYERFGDKAGVDTIAAVLHVEGGVHRVRTTVELPGDFDGSLERRASGAIRRYCRLRIADLERELRRIRRYGLWALALGAVAVFVLNAAARPLESSEDDFLQALSTGLQVAAWVTLWFPINLLVYDRWYARRDRAIYRAMLEMELRLVTAREGGAPTPSTSSA